MKATETNFLKFLQGTKQFVIPIYQRTYSWTRPQCEQLWNDIRRVAENDKLPAHFVGSIVYIERGIYQVTAVPQLLVIDGQQRLTTLSLLLAALGNVIQEKNADVEMTHKKINNYYLLNNEESGERRYKLLLTQSDRETLKRLVDGVDLPEHPSPRIVENYRYFEDQIRKFGFDLETLYRGIAKLVIVDISLDRNHDNPQLIFESLNSTGVDLSQADLIRNYVLMGIESDEQTMLYNTYWYPMEQSFGHAEYSALFDRFMRDYLTVKSKSGAIPKINEVYASFKAYMPTTNSGIEQLVADVYTYSKYFTKLALDRETDPHIREAIADINQLKVDVAYPFLLELYADYAGGLLPASDFVAVLRLVESYVFRRAICGIPTNSLNNTFAEFSRGIDKADYLNSVKLAFLRRDSYRRFPTDEEFQAALLIKDVYNFRSRNYLLRRLENHDRKEKVGVENCTIEHIMPQNEDLSPEWREALGPDWQTIQAQYLHTLGNLTLTGYNSELSDRPFQEKRDMLGGFADSPLRLNHMLAKLDHWNAEQIHTRAQHLANLALSIWSSPALPPHKMHHLGVKTANPENSISNLEPRDYLQGPLLEFYEELSKRILNLDPSIQIHYKKQYIAYKTSTNFVDVEPRKTRLILFLNMPFAEIDDPRNLCRDVTNIGHYGNGDIEIGLSAMEQLDDIMALVKQSYERHDDDTDVSVAQPSLWSSTEG